MLILRCNTHSVRVNSQQLYSLLDPPLNSFDLVLTRRPNTSEASINKSASEYQHAVLTRQY